ncbi:unnamed protein product [Vitrella brassicaformis CCMP3155]|uniref:Uncharacterized protein n=1 Tax=Vitrella brassicaformis (strain CCMP3155) TaxID=1169540 RepID=A0A0G4GN36_VITBC|nr:unnamed protein product [Vitrella brassicaformis CCMP3155]|eukprot:CEM31623.1 unnamed protein product [Vitrella brassicaformis CCMP3155]
MCEGFRRSGSPGGSASPTVPRLDLHGDRRRSSQPKSSRGSDDAMSSRVQRLESASRRLLEMGDTAMADLVINRQMTKQVWSSRESREDVSEDRQGLPLRAGSLPLLDDASHEQDSGLSSRGIGAYLMDDLHKSELIADQSLERSQRMLQQLLLRNRLQFWARTADRLDEQESIRSPRSAPSQRSSIRKMHTSASLAGDMTTHHVSYGISDDRYRGMISGQQRQEGGEDERDSEILSLRQALQAERAMVKELRLELEAIQHLRAKVPEKRTLDASTQTHGHVSPATTPDNRGLEIVTKDEPVCSSYQGHGHEPPRSASPESAEGQLKRGHRIHRHTIADSPTARKKRDVQLPMSLCEEISKEIRNLSVSIKSPPHADKPRPLTIV